MIEGITLFPILELLESKPPSSVPSPVPFELEPEAPLELTVDLPSIESAVEPAIDIDRAVESAADAVLTILERSDEKEGEQPQDGQQQQPDPEPQPRFETPTLQLLAAETTKPTHVSAAAWMAPILETLEVWRESQTIHVARLDIDDVKCNLRLVEGKVHIELQAPTPAAAIAFQRDQRTLTARLAKHGLALTSFAVSTKELSTH